MDWIAALALSLPIACAVAYSAWLRQTTALSTARTAYDAVIDGVDKLANVLGESLQHAAETLADAHVRAAKYQSRAIKPTPKKEKPGEISIFDAWLAREGKLLPQSVQDQVEWAIGRLRGIESDDQGDDDDARVILANYAHGVAKAVEDEIATKKS